MVNQLRQRFALEYPEAAAQTWQTNDHGMTPIIEWLIGKNHHGRRVNHYNNSVANSLGIDISEYSLACIIHEEKTKQKNKQLASKLIWKEMDRKKIANMTNKTLKNELKKLKLCCVDIVIL